MNRREKFEIEPLLIEASQRAQGGQCHAFALAFHELTGWPLWGAYKVSDDETEDGRLVHIVVEHPSGRLLDAHEIASVENRVIDSKMFGNDPWDFAPIGGPGDVLEAIEADSKSIWAEPDVQAMRPIAAEIHSLLDLDRDEAVDQLRRLAGRLVCAGDADAWQYTCSLSGALYGVVAMETRFAASELRAILRRALTWYEAFSNLIDLDVNLTHPTTGGPYTPKRNTEEFRPAYLYAPVDWTLGCFSP